MTADGSRPGVAIVTGAARGIGAATVERLHADGYLVVAVDQDLAGLAERWPDDTHCRTVGGDVADPRTARAAVEAATAWGPLRVLVNNAGIAVDRAFVAQSDEQWQRVYDSVAVGTRVMTLGVIHQMQADVRDELTAGPDATPSARRVINTVPFSAVTATAGGSASAAAGGAVISLTRTLARELGAYGIRVNAVLVGYITTRMTAALPPGESQASLDHPGLPEPVRQMAAATTALGRFGDPTEVAAVHSFLAGPDADYVTGAVIPVTGGLLGT